MDYQQIHDQFQKEISQVKNEKDLENIRISYLGSKGKITQALKEIPNLAPEKRKDAGTKINKFKKEIEEAIKLVQCNLQKTASKEKDIDVTAPGQKPPLGHLHLVTQAIQEISEIFERLGFQRRSYPEADWDWYAFEGLNMPKNHPARDEWETFFVDAPVNSKLGNIVLTPHTSNGQLREMESCKPPIKMINTAKCYRRQSDVSHTPVFHQFEGLVIDKNINITNLKGTLDYFAENFLGKGRKSRIRPFHFQFTEPSFEVDVSCGVCNGAGCRLCKEGWLELGGAGMVHPNVLRNGGIDPEIYTGFAFGWGVERSLSMKPGLKLDDVRLLYQNDLRFLEQF